MDFEKNVKDYLAYLTLERRVSRHTVTAYQTDLTQFQHFLWSIYEIETVDLIESHQIRSWLVALKDNNIADLSLRRKASALKAFFQFLIQRGQVKANPVRKIILPKISKPLPQFLETAQTEQIGKDPSFLEDFDGNTARLILELLYQTGMRRAELINLKEIDINFGRKEVLIFGKGNKARVVPLNETLLIDLNEYINLKRKLFDNTGNYLLSLKSGKQLYDNFVYRVVNKYLKKVSTLKKTSPHLLRHTFATQLLNNGADLMAIKDLLGHSSLAATQVYTHVNIERLKDVYKNTHPKS